MTRASSDDAQARAWMTLIGCGCLTVLIGGGLIVGIVATLWRVWH